MKSPGQSRKLLSILLTLMIGGGLFVLTGCALYILGQGNSNFQLSRPQRLQTSVLKPTPRTGFKTPVAPEQALIKSSRLVSPIARPTEIVKPIENQHPSTFDEIVVEVNNVALSKHKLQIVLDADQAMGLLLHTTVAIDRAIALERLINGELVRQAAQPAGFTLEEATIKQSLQAFLMANQKDATDLEQALSHAQLTRAEFTDYFGSLLLIDRFVRKQAAQLHIADAAYLLQLQRAAHISFGPAATSTITTTSESLTMSNPVTTTFANSIPVAASAVAASDAISFTLPALNDTNGQTLTLQSLLGHPTVLSFWTTWCPYCKRQTPLLVAAHAQYAQQGIQFVGIDVKDAPTSVQTYIATNQIRYPILLDVDGQVANAYNVHGFPTTLFLDAQGHVVARQIGALTAEQLTKQLQQLVKNAN